MADFIQLQQGVAEGIIQGILDARRKARTIEEAAEMVAPYVDPQSTHACELVNNIREHAAKLGHWLKVLYDRNAKEVFGVPPVQPLRGPEMPRPMGYEPNNINP